MCPCFLCALFSISKQQEFDDFDLKKCDVQTNGMCKTHATTITSQINAPIRVNNTK